ncbi:GNAT family N-acetyltransferase [Frankia gtarii]|uniref:GNAT family N-acetyltransferase n=1 Tax=Frankia gtarii TaxID=2950102 RepID=UPI0021C25463|nr:GNAT family N-acetyltransferase [Frankia gtarii]
MLPGRPELAAALNQPAAITASRSFTKHRPVPSGDRRRGKSGALGNDSRDYKGVVWFMTEDVETYLAVAGGFLLSRLTENTVLATVAETLRAGNGAVFGDAVPLFGCWRSDGGDVDGAFLHGGLTLWEVDGVPVSMAGLTRSVADMVRVGPVYTPPHTRRRGYAGAVTAAVSRAALDAGAKEVLLFTDLANRTSNGLYQRLGYEPVEDRVVLSFT